MDGRERDQLWPTKPDSGDRHAEARTSDQSFVTDSFLPLHPSPAKNRRKRPLSHLPLFSQERISYNADSTVTTDTGGYFRAERLAPGDYTVKVSVAGFSDYTAQHVLIEVGKLTEVMPKLGIAGSTATVEVSSESPVINTESSDFTNQLNSTALATLPINGEPELAIDTAASVR